MRIGIISGEYPPMQGGVGDYTRALARAIAAAGHEVYILTSTAAQPVQHTLRVHVQPSVSRWGRWGKDDQSVRGDRQALSWIDKNRLDIVNVQYQAAAYDMHVAVNNLPRRLRQRVPVVTTFHDLLVPYLFPKAGGLRKRVIYQMARHSSGVIVTNMADEHELHAAGDMPRIARIPIGSNIAVAPPPGYTKQSWRQQMHVPDDVLLVGYFGFVNASKGIDTLAHAIRLLVEREVNVELLIIGGQAGSSDRTNIEQADAIERLIGGLGINRRVRWTGFIEPAAVSAFLMACDVVALPFKDGVSLRRGTLMAALAHGCSIVTTFPGELGPPELKDRVNLRMVHPENPQFLADVLQELWRDPAQRTRLGEAAAEVAHHFEWESIADKTLNFLEWLTDKHKTEPHLRTIDHK
ncbi:MAG: glycosyltransferase family 4 protein [Chloroflexi bacterium]|nr:glycosyltransferase family 4 protein [Chloroflexota bacterium]